MSNLQLQTLLPLLLSEEPNAVAAKLEVLSACGIITANDILFPPSNVTPPVKALIISLHPRILGFLAAEGSQASTLYKPDLPFPASTGNKAIDGLFPNRSMAFLPSEIVEIVGNHGSGRTYLMLQTVLRSLQKEKSAYALWLDTEGKFKAEDAASVLFGIHDEEASNGPPAAGQPAPTGLESNSNGVGLADNAMQRSDDLSALDRLIVSKAFDLQAAIRAIQEVRRDGFPTPQTEAEPKIEQEMEKIDENPIPVEMINASKRQAGEQHDPAEGAEPVKAVSAQSDEASTSEDAVNVEQPIPKAAEGYHRDTQRAAKSAEPAAEHDMHLRFIVIDSLTPLLSKLFSRESAEGKKFRPPTWSPAHRFSPQGMRR
jgi:hypothetical protein